MRKLPLLIFSCLIALPAITPVAIAQIYTSPRGSDSQPGTAQRPVLTLQHALDLSRASGNAAIILENGTYRLATPLTLTAADSGSAGHDRVIAAAPGAHPVLSGAIRIAGWKKVDAAKNLWAAPVPLSIKNSRQLYVNGVRAFRARGRVPVSLTPTPIGYLAASDVMAHWRNPSDIEFVYTGGNDIWSEHSEGLGAWTQPECPVESIAGREITMAQPCWNNSTRRAMLPNGARTANLVGPMSVGKQPEYIENAYELLGTPGKWYFDRPAHRVYYVPRPGENLGAADVEMPVLQTLVAGNGTAADPIRNIVFRGIQFAYATWLGPSGPDGFSEIQANYQVTGPDGYSRQALCRLVPNGTCPFGAWTPAPGNVEFHYAHHIKFLDDDFVHLGAAALSLGDGSQDDSVQGCLFTDISGNGVDLGGVNQPLAPVAEFTSGNRIENNLFRDVGAEYRGGIPIVVGYARNTIIAHNEIDHVPYAAISMGWGGWPDKIRQPGQANHSAGNVVRDNRIHDLMLVLADGGGIYTQGITGPDLGRGEKVTGNVIYGQFSSGHAIYTDNGSSMVIIRGNVIFHTNMDNWGSRHRDYYEGQDGSNFDPLDVEQNYWQQGDEDSAKKNVTVSGNHLIEALAQAPQSILENAGLPPRWKSALEQRYARIIPASAPEPPSRVAAAPGNGFAYVTFSPPVNNGGGVVKNYTVTASTGAKTSISAKEYRKFAYLRFSGLRNGEPVTFTVEATNANGTSEPSLPSHSVMPQQRTVELPDAPSAVSAYAGDRGTVSIHFKAPVNEQHRGELSSIIAYLVTVRPSGRKVVLTGRNILTLSETRHTTFDVISGLKPGTYTFAVQAVNEAGAGATAVTGPIKVH